MKKRNLLISCMVALIVCLFAISVSAADEVTVIDGDSTKTVNIEEVFAIDSNGFITGFKDSEVYNASNIQDIIYPETVAGLKCKSLFKNSTVIKTITIKGYSFIMHDSSNHFDGSSLTTVTFEKGHDCVLNVRYYTTGVFQNCKSLTSITFPTITKLNADGTADTGEALSYMFTDCSNMVAQNDIRFGEGLVSIGGERIFGGCSSLSNNAEGKCEVYFPSTIKTINHRSFQNAGITAIHLDGCTNLTTIGHSSWSEGTFSGTKLTSVDFSDCTSLNALCPALFFDCSSLTNVYGLESTKITELKTNTFYRCASLRSVKLPNTLESVGDEAFTGVGDITVYFFSAPTFKDGWGTFNHCSGKVEIVLIGVSAQDFKANASVSDVITNATVVDYLDSESPYSYVVGQTLTDHTIVENYCKSLALTDKHSFSDTPCVICCSECKFLTVKENPEHNKVVSVVYENGYASAGKKLTTCTNEGCPLNKAPETVDLSSLFICLGYSAPENGTCGIVMGYTVNHQAITEYEEATGKTLKYGVFVVSKEKLAENDIFDENGTAANGVVSAKITTNHVAFQLKIVGFETDKQKAAELAMGAYVAVTDDGVTEYSYIQTGEKAENEKYVFSSYNELLPTV